MNNDIVVSKMEDIRNELRSRMSPVHITIDGIICDLILPEGYYQGEIRDKLRHGKGTMYYYDGNICKGCWANGLANGEVELINKDGKIIYKGNMINGLANGEGVMANIRSLQYYEGEFKNSLYHGYGKLFNSEHELLYEGEWEEGIQCGHGTSYVKGKRSYEGEWEHGMPNGQGTSYNENGDILYCGKWKDGVTMDIENRINKASKEYKQ